MTVLGTSVAKVRVLIIDDSAYARQIMTEILRADAWHRGHRLRQRRPCGPRDDPQLNPDVLTLDVEMPRMDGLTFLRNLMRLRPMPVVMVSSLTERGAEVTLEALALGAVDFLPKPHIDLGVTLRDYAVELVSKVKAAARVGVRATTPGSAGRAVRPGGASLPKAYAATRADQYHRRHSRHRRLHRRHGGDPGVAERTARRRAGHRHHPAHTERLQCRFCQAPR